jgi:formate hydrogenlyase subunit 3/multisubunit Na+/H+ antiporter MnhD subunit
MIWLLLLTGALPLVLAAFAIHRRSWWTPSVGALPALAAGLLVPIGESLDLPWLLLGTRLGLDETARIFLLFTATLWTIAGFSASEALRGTREAGRFRVFFLLAMTGNLWLIIGQDLVSFYAGFALMGLASYGLVIHNGDRAALRAGKVYLALTLVGELALFLALVLIASQIGGLLPEPEDLADLQGTAIALLILGLGIKAGLVPLHVWVPLAYPAAPVAAAAVLSGAMSKVALLGWLRFLPLGEVASPEWGSFMVFLGMATLLYALPVGLLQSDPRTLLAYSSIGKAGLFVLVLGLILIEPALAPVGIAGLVLYAAHHALVKGGLFLGVGLRGWTTRQGTLQGWILGGLILLALAMAGAPLTSGALAKFAIKPILEPTDWAWLNPAMALVTLLTALLMLRFIQAVSRQPRPPGAGLDWSRAGGSGMARATVAWAILVVLVALLPFALGGPRRLGDQHGPDVDRTPDGHARPAGRTPAAGRASPARGDGATRRPPGPAASDQDQSALALTAAVARLGSRLARRQVPHRCSNRPVGPAKPGSGTSHAGLANRRSALARHPHGSPDPRGTHPLGAMSSLLVVAWVFPLILAAGARHPRLWWTPGVGAAPALCAALLIPTDTRLELDWLLIGATFGLDEIGRIFLLFTSILWLAAGIYAAASMRGTRHVGRFNTFFLLAMAGNLWLITGQDLVSFYVGFALMGISSYGLVIHEGDPAALRAGKVYLVLTLAAEVTLFVALVMIASTTGSIQPTPDDLVELDELTIGLLILGLAVKAGLVPLHVWLPLAHPAAPIPASAVLSGAMIKVALLGWLRFLPIGEIALPGWGLLFVFAGLATALFAVPIGLVQSNPKVLLAYSSVSKMGLMVIILGLMLLEPGVAPAAAMGLALYAGHHALAKGGLFLGVGLRKSAGAQGLVFSGLLLLALSMAAVPLTGGAVAKYGIKPVFAEIDWAWLKVAIALTTMATAFMMARFIWSMWHLKRAHPGERSVLADPERIAKQETGGGRASKIMFVLNRAAQWASFATRPSVDQNQAGHPERGSVPKVNWAAVGWVPLIGLVVLYPMVLGSPEAWVTDAGLIGLAILLALPVILIAIRRPAAVAPLVDKIEPGDLLGLVRPVLLAGHLSLRWSVRAYRPRECPTHGQGQRTSEYAHAKADPRSGPSLDLLAPGRRTLARHHGGFDRVGHDGSDPDAHHTAGLGSRSCIRSTRPCSRILRSWTSSRRWSRRGCRCPPPRSVRPRRTRSMAGSSRQRLSRCRPSPQTPRQIRSSPSEPRPSPRLRLRVRSAIRISLMSSAMRQAIAKSSWRAASSSRGYRSASTPHHSRTSWSC